MKKLLPKFNECMIWGYEEVVVLLETFKTERKNIYKAQIRNNILWSLGPLSVCAIIAIIYLALGNDANGGLKTFSWGYALLFLLSVLSLLAFIFQLFRERIMMLSFFWKEDHIENLVLRKEFIKSFVAGGVLFIIAMITFTIIEIRGPIVFNKNKMRFVTDVVLEKDCREISVRKGKNTYYYYQFKIMDNPKIFWWRRGDHLYQFRNGNNPDKYFKEGDTVSLLVDKNDVIDDVTDPDERNTVYDVWKKGEESMLDKVAWGAEATANFKQSIWILAAMFSALSLVLIFRTKKRKDKLEEGVSEG